MENTNLMTIHEDSNLRAMHDVQQNNLDSTFQTLTNQFNAVRKFIASNFVAGVDYGAIPNKDESKLRNTLLLPGAEKIILLLKLQVFYDLVDKTIDIPNNFIDYEYKCIIRTNDDSFTVEAIASCNSREKGFDFVDDALKVKDNIAKKARKRALIDAVQKVSGIRDYFNQPEFQVISLDRHAQAKKAEQAKKELENKLNYAIEQIKKSNAKNFEAVKNKYSDLKDFTEFKQAIEQKALELTPKKVEAVPEVPETKKVEAAPEVIETKKDDKPTDELLTKSALEEISTASTVEQLKAIKEKYNGLSKRSPVYKKALETKISLLLNNLLEDLKNDLDNCFDNAVLKMIVNNSKYDSLKVHPEYKEFYAEIIDEVKERLTPPAQKKEIKVELVQDKLISENDMLPKFENMTEIIEIEPTQPDLAERLKSDFFEYNLSKNSIAEIVDDINQYHERKNPTKSIDYSYNFMRNRIESYLMQIQICKNLQDIHSFEHAMPGYAEFKSMVNIVKNKKEYFTVLYKADKLLSLNSNK